jgi:hypothetical protein
VGSFPIGKPDCEPHVSNVALRRKVPICREAAAVRTPLAVLCLLGSIDRMQTASSSSDEYSLAMHLIGAQK